MSDTDLIIVAFHQEFRAKHIEPIVASVTSMEIVREQHTYRATVLWIFGCTQIHSLFVNGTHVPWNKI